MPINSGVPVVTEFIVKTSKKSNFRQFTISLLVNIFWMFNIARSAAAIKRKMTEGEKGYGYTTKQTNMYKV